MTVTGNGDRFLLFWEMDFSQFCISLIFAVSVYILCSKMLAFGLIREAFSFTHPCSSQELYLKIEAVSNQVKAASGEIMISSKNSLHLFFPTMRKTPSMFFGMAASQFNTKSAPMILRFPPYSLLTM